MRYTFLLIIILILSTSNLYAGPASPDPIDILQPDGTTIKAGIRGDEFQNWTESEETGHTILHNKISGFWEFAEQTTDGTLRSSGRRVRPKGLNESLSIPKSLKPPRNLELEQRMHQMLNDVYQQRLNSPGINSSSTTTVTDSSRADSALGDWVPVAVSGSRKALIILISFADRDIQTAPANWYTSVFDENAKSVVRYFKDSSFGLLTISPAPHTQSGNPAGVVSVTVADNHPNYDNNYVYATETTILNHALAQASTFVNFAVFDTNGNGTLDQSELAVYFIYAGYEASGSSRAPSVWAHAWSGSITAGTKNITRWAQNGELNDSSVQHPMGVIAHELGHALCGLPDLYDVSGQNQAMGAFSLMASGSWGKDSIDSYSGMTPTALDVWSRVFLGWTTPVVPESSGTMSLGHVLATRESAYKLVVPATSTTEYFLIENRQPVNWDKGLKRWLGGNWLGGLLILHIDNTAGSFPGNNINSFTENSSTPGHQGVVPVSASSSCNMLSIGATCAGNASTLFYSNNKNSWTPSSTPNSNYYNSNATNFSLTNISSQSSTMTAFLLLPPSAPVATTSGASGVVGTFATLKGTVNDNNASTTVTFQYGLTSGYGSTASGGTITAGSGSSAVSAAISGLVCNSTYHFRAGGTNSIGTSNGADSTFSTTACPPGAPAITSVAAGNSLANIYFTQPGSNGGSPVISYTATSSSGQSVTGDTVPITVSGLVNGSSYTFTVRATNAAGTGPAAAASVNVAPGVVVIDDIDETGYQLLQYAYDAEVYEKKIKILAGENVGGLTVNPSNVKGSITIKGGYNNAFSEDDGLPSILGKVTLSAGTTKFQNVIVRSP